MIEKPFLLNFAEDARTPLLEVHIPPYDPSIQGREGAPKIFAGTQTSRCHNVYSTRHELLTNYEDWDDEWVTKDD